MLLTSTVRIKASADKIFNFFEEMDKNYLRWHPEHILFEWKKGHGLQVGKVFYSEEKINGQLWKKQTRFSKIIPNELIEFELTNWFFRMILPRISFIIKDMGDYCEVTQEIPIRIGPIGAYLSRKKFNAVRIHMMEEGENLKRLMEKEI